jgi:outer membrane protein OmpA-like peptidoglycan-associated protein
MVLSPLRSLVTLMSACLCAACSVPSGRVLLLPQEGGAGAVTVSTASAASVLSEPYAVAQVDRKGAMQQLLSSEAEVRQRYPSLLALMPPREERFTLHFLPGTSDLTPESVARLDGIITSARNRSGGEIVIVGHTDRQGAAEANDALSLRRAQSIRDVLVRRGFLSDLIEPVGRGEREPAVPTDDGVAEPRNRRADIIVR